jgi:DNA-binding NtrC family response regulator
MSHVLPSPEPARIGQGRFDEERFAALSVARVLITAARRDDVEAIARRIHGSGTRALYPFVQTRARDLPRSRAALRDACRRFCEAAAGGSVLLTDVEETAEKAQLLLLDVLDDVDRWWHEGVRPRLMSGTTVPLLQRVAEGRFSADFFYRLNIIHVVADGRHEASRAEREVAALRDLTDDAGTVLRNFDPNSRKG